MSLDNVEDEFQQWNPMEKDFRSADFNQYYSGPGANLDSSLLASRQTWGQKAKTADGNTPVPFLLFKNLPAKMTKSGLFNICSKHGKVTSVRDSQKCDYFFVNFATVADMESAFRALENNNYGFTVLIGRNKKPKADHQANFNNITPVPPRTTGIDYQNRSYCVSKKHQPRPKFDESPVFEDSQCNGLSAEIINHDAHALEREGLGDPLKHEKFNFRTGRANAVMPQSTKVFVETKHKESEGHYSPTRDTYVNKKDASWRPSKFSHCLHCNRECDTVCSRCTGYYCNQECQRSDWQKHRLICGKPGNCNKPSPEERDKENQTHESGEKEELHKQQDKTPATGKDELAVPPFPRSGNIVTITAISKTNIVFIRSKTYEDNISYFKTVDGLQAMGKTLKPLSKMPACGNVVVAKVDNQFNRAIVLNAKNPENIFVNYLDYGNLDNLRLEDLLEAPYELIQTPRHAIPVILKGVPDCYMTQELRKFMYSYLEGINVHVKYKPEDYNQEKNVHTVQLIDEITQQNLNKMIRKLSEPKEPKDTADICFMEYLNQKLLPTGSDIELIVMDNSSLKAGCISCTTKLYAIEIQKFQKEIQKYVESIPNESYAPRVNELCVARYSEDGLWYRGRCLELVGDAHPTIHFIDFGNVCVINIDSIRRYPSQFTFPIYTADCEIAGLPSSCEGKIIDVLETLIPHGGTIKCEKVTMENKNDHFYTLSLPDIIRKLSIKGLV